MTKRQLAIRAVLEKEPATRHIYAVIHNEVVKGLIGMPNAYKNSNGLDLADSLRQHENNFINSFNR